MAPVALEKIREIAERVAASEGLEVLEVEFRGGRHGLLRIYIDRSEERRVGKECRL